MLYNGILLLLSFLLPAICLLIFPAMTRAIVKDIRLIRILHYVALALLGYALYFSNAYDPALFLQPRLLLIFALLSMALAYAAVFAIVSNNIADLETDRISNRNRPLVTASVKPAPYLLAGIFCLVYSLLLSLLTDRIMFVGILLISAGYFIYSCEPFRLKRIPFLAKLFIGFNSLVITVCGFMLAGGQLTDFPVAWAVFIILPLSLAANFVDLKDTMGDGLNGVKTLPVIFGEHRALHLIVFFTACTYIMAALIIHLIWVYPLCALMAVLHITFLYRKPYNEKPVFLIYISALFGLNIILLFNKYISW